MFDQDGNQRVDKNEFLLVIKIASFIQSNKDIQTDEIRSMIIKNIFSFYFLKKLTPTFQSAKHDQESAQFSTHLVFLLFIYI